MHGPRDGVTPSFDARRRDPRALRKAQNAEDERKNWMVLEPGQLDAEDQEKTAFGLRDYDLEKPKKKRDYFFDPPEQKEASQGNRNSAEVKDSDPNDNGAKGGQPETKDGRALGDHVSKELDLKNLLATGKANSLAPSEDKTTKLWRDVLGSSGTSESRGEASGRREEGPAADGFRPSASSSFQGSTPSFGFRNDFNARPAPAGSPAYSSSASTRPTSPSAPLVPRGPETSFGRPSAPATTTRVPTPNNTYGGTRPGSAPGPSGSAYGQQPPARRQSSGSFDIPARPGYGGR